jgi:cytochrome c-type biogenesis protein CcmH
MISLVSGLVLGLTLVTQAPRSPQDSAVEARTTRLAAVLRCPVCQGLSIQDSPSELSQQMRALVKEQVALGKTDEEVKAYFVGRYGEWILLEPKATGFNLLVYLLPLVALIGGALVVRRVVKKWTTPSSPVST